MIEILIALSCWLGGITQKDGQPWAQSLPREPGPGISRAAKSRPAGGPRRSSTAKVSAPLPAPMVLSDEARRWAADKVGPGGTPRERLLRLHRALTGSRGRRIREALGSTPTAMQAFDGRRANCVAYAHLLVGLARALGIPAYFVHPPAIEARRRQGGYEVLERHLATAHGPDAAPLMLDLGGSLRLREGEGRRVSDREAKAIFLSNRGAEALLDGRPKAALDWLRSAVALAPELRAARANYALAWRRAGGVP